KIIPASGASCRTGWRRISRRGPLPARTRSGRRREGNRVSKAALFVRHGDLARFIVAAFVAKEMAAEHARTIADALVWANLRGGDSHGVVRLPRYVDLIATGEMDPAARPTMALDYPTRFVLDGNRCAGPVAMMQASAAAVERTKLNGLCVGLVR